MDFTKEQKEEYLKHGTFCPNCDFDGLNELDHDYDGNIMNMTVACGSCGLIWVETYLLSDIHIIEEEQTQ